LSGGGAVVVVVVGDARMAKLFAQLSIGNLRIGNWHAVFWSVLEWHDIRFLVHIFTTTKNLYIDGCL